MSGNEKSSVVIYPFYFINWQSIHKANCMQRIKKILIWELLPVIAFKTFTFERINNIILLF